MMPKPIRLLLIGGLLLNAVHTASAQELDRDPEQESLMDIYQRALQNDPAIREAEARYLAASEVRPQRRSDLLPSLRLQASTSATNQTDPRPPTDFITGQPSTEISSTDSDADTTSWGVSIEQTVFDWGQFVTLKQADKLVAQAETEYEAAKQQLLIRVSEAYFNVLGAEDALAAQVAARQSLERQLEQAQRRFEVGLIAITEVQEIQAGFDQAVAAEIEAQRVLATSREQLREIIGDYVADLAGPSGDLPLQRPDPANVDQWVRAALQQNLSLIAARIGADVAEDDIAIARSARLPTLSFSTGYQDQTRNSSRTLNRIAENDLTTSAINRSYGYNWQLNLNVPLFTGGLNSSRIQQSVYEHRATLEASERVARETERQTRDAYLGVVSSISQVQALARFVESAETALRATEAGFEVGTRTSVDVLVSQENLRQAQTQYARSRYDYILNVLRLRQSAGSLSVDDVEQVDAWLQ